MKVAISQLNYHVGNIESNCTKILEAIESAKHNNADLIVFSELSLCGYPPLDLLEKRSLLNKTEKFLEIIKNHSEGIGVIVGSPRLNSDSGKNLFNSAFFFDNKDLHSVIDKTLLPSYDVFDENRYFQSNNKFKTIEYKGEKIALTICEDLWEEQQDIDKFVNKNLYKISPMDLLIKENPTLMINIAASPFTTSKNRIRKEVLSNKCTKYNLPLIYVNQTGANTDIVFDGNSMVINSKGDVIKQLSDFNEDLQYIETKEIDSETTNERDLKEHIELIHDALVVGLKDYFIKTGFKTATLGLSGGIDSAVVCVLAAEALGNENIRVLLLPSQFSSDHSIKDAEDLAKNLNIKYDIVPIKSIYDSFENSLSDIFAGTKFNVAEENIQARIRGTLLMGISNKFGNILLNTTNKSEAAVGYGTLYGDMNGGISLLGDVYKTEVFDLARFINKEREIIPINTIVKPPSAELRPDQKDEDSLPPYDILDFILKEYIEKNVSAEDIIAKGYNPETVKRIIHLVNCNEYKRYQIAPTIKVSNKAFGQGRRIPLVAKY